MAKEKGQKMIYKTLHSKLKIEQLDPHLKLGRVSSSCSTSGTGCELVLLFNFHFIIVNNLHWYLLYIIYCLFLVTEWTMAFPSNVNVLRTCQKIAYFPMRYLSTRGRFTMISPFCGTVSYNCSIIGLQAIIEQ